MTTRDGEPTGGLSDIGELGDEWSFTLYDGLGREVVALAYDSEAKARRAHKAVQMAIGDAVAISLAFEQLDIFTVEHHLCHS